MSILDMRVNIYHLYTSIITNHLYTNITVFLLRDTCSFSCSQAPVIQILMFLKLKTFPKFEVLQIRIRAQNHMVA